MKNGGIQMSNYWYENFKDNPDFYSRYCSKLCRSLGINELHTVKVLYFANLIHTVTAKYDDILLQCGIRLPSETFTWKLRKRIQRKKTLTSKAFWIMPMIWSMIMQKLILII